MKSHGAKKQRQTVSVWELDQARRAVPYIAAIMRSLREHRLEALGLDQQVQHLKDKPGRPDRTAIVEQTELAKQAQAAHDRFDQAMDELNSLDVFCIDPIQGEAVIPFLHDRKLAWYVFDLFDEGDPLRFWRAHDDPLEARRPIADVQAEAGEHSRVA